MTSTGCDRTSRWIVDEAERNRVGRVVICGDLLTSRSMQPTHVLSACYHFLGLLSDTVPRVHIILGNHDLGYRRDYQTTTLNALDIERLNPYVEEQDELTDAVAALKPQSASETVAFAQLAINKAITQRYVVGPNRFSSLARTFTGHFHNHQTIMQSNPGPGNNTLSGGVTYLGSPLQLNWADLYDNQRGIFLFNPKTLEHKTLVNPHAIGYTSGKHVMIVGELTHFKYVTARDKLLSLGVRSVRNWSSTGFGSYATRVPVGGFGASVPMSDVPIQPMVELDEIQAVPELARKDFVYRESDPDNDTGSKPAKLDIAAEVCEYVESLNLDECLASRRGHLARIGQRIMQASHDLANQDGEPDLKYQDFVDNSSSVVGTRTANQLAEHIFVAKSRTLTISNFLGVQGTIVIDFQRGIRRGLTFLVGHNSSGKSTLVEAMVWCQFGRCIRTGLAANDVVNDIVGSNCSVTLEFSNGYIIARHRKHKTHGNRVVVSLNGEPQLQLEHPDTRTTQAAVNELLGIDYEMYVRTVVLDHESASSFLSSTSTQRRDLIEASLGLSILDQFGQVAKVLLKDIDKDMNETGSKTQARYHSEAEDVSIPTPVIPVRNTKAVIHIGQNLVVWKADDIKEYEDNSEAHIAASYYPVALDIRSESLDSRGVDIYLNVTKDLLGIPFTVHGVIDAAHEAISLDPSQPLTFNTVDTHKIRVTASPSWSSIDIPWAVVGDISWRLKFTSSHKEITLNSTRLELYAINKKLPAFYKNDVNVRLLRRVVAPIREKSDTAAWIDHCCRSAHTDFRFIYDTFWGGSRYNRTATGGSFRLDLYLLEIGQGLPVNCHDQAAVMQICFGLGPTTDGVGWVLMNKFGYISPTALVGHDKHTGPFFHAKCNNPFFRNEWYYPKMMAPTNAKNRSWFGNHAFVSLDPSHKDKIVDTCCGPINGTIDIQEYVRKVIQTEEHTDLYQQLGLTPGTAEDADFAASGLTDLKGLQVLPLIPQQSLASAPFSDEVAEMIQAATVPAAFSSEGRSNASLGNLFTNRSLEPLGWSIRHTFIAVSTDGTSGEWILKPTDSDDDIDVRIFLAAGGARETTAAIASHLETYSVPLRKVFQAPSPQSGTGVFLELQSIGSNVTKDDIELEGKWIWIWSTNNVAVTMMHRYVGQHDNGPQFLKLKDKLREVLADGTKPIGSDEILTPKVSVLQGTEAQVVVGKEFEIRISTDGSPYTTVYPRIGNVVLLEDDQTNGVYKFYATNVGEDIVTFGFAHRETLNSTIRQFTVTVVDANT
ncbi:hypothetical protein HJFPF1_12307 [Paramyrothecium foliicola]|nr:hypothetical protein HJFPF1_12307 [Paramyrothecium foliicola]